MESQTWGGPLADSDILKTAVSCGIMLSTGYGQESGRRMPVSDHKTIVEFARAIILADRKHRSGEAQ